MMRFVLIFSFLSLFSTQVFAQLEEEYYDIFRQAKLHIANHDEASAIPLLEDLWKRDHKNANVAYHLGASYIKQEQKIKQAVKLLEYAKENFSPYYNRAAVTERRASEYTYYYLIIGYSLTGKCDQTVETLNEFYTVFSYEDEWFLVEGQKWHRICGKKQFKDEQEDMLADADSVIAEAQESAEEAPVEKDVIDGAKEENNEDDEEIAPLADYKLSTEAKLLKPSSGWSRQGNYTRTKTPEKQYRDRLTPITDPESRGIQTKRVNYTTTHSLYGVQVGAYIDPKFTRDFDGIKNVEVYMDQNGVFRYVVGRLIYPQQAAKLLEFVKEAGYKDAFIVDINGATYQEEVVTLDNIPIKKDIRGKVDFRVQIGAFRDTIPDELVRTYLRIDRIRENIQGDLTVLTVGSYGSYDIAKRYCEHIKEIGLPDAFVVSYNYETKISVTEAKKYIDDKKSLRVEEQEKNIDKLEKLKDKEDKKKEKKDKL
ncbi:MAG TPA: hypothetical protein DCS15_08785 [Flavobacteriales bacterium]|nr:hypothetical protein [Flavobacteriales bacterium]